ncbi:MAG: (2Fe-2S)-binding protein [Sphingomonadales bacterium]|nr:MAG: (2Fe-2S)-binding protein [Sphingomonadales bacterium]
MHQEPVRSLSGLPIPFGWFAIGYSEDLAPGDHCTMNYFADEFVLWRGEDGGLRALDPYCPHLGAHLGHGGVVVGNDLQCPFHHWQFNGEGAVTHIPYSETIPPVLRRACTGRREVAEAHGVIYGWYHPDRAAPLWELASVPEIDEGEWRRFERREWRIPIHAQEITENGIDYAHFRSIHGTKSPPEPNWTIKGFSRESHVVTKMETPRGLIDGSIHVRNTGPGQSFIRFGGISELLLINLPTPIDADNTHLRQDFYMPKALDEKQQRAAAAVARNVIFQLDQDIPIWQHKRYEPKPLLVKGDGPILAYRRQYAQYYTTPPAQ